MRKRNAGKELTEADMDFPTVRDGLSGVRFINKCVESARLGGVWVSVE
jgi:hypothetical protein